MGKTSTGKTRNKRVVLGPQEIRKSAAKYSSKKKQKQRPREQIDQARHALDSNAQKLYEVIGGPTTSHFDRPQDEIDHVKVLTETIMSL
jgi:hypothetical protein